MRLPALRIDDLSAAAVETALRTAGGFLLRWPALGPRSRDVIAAARALFSLPKEDKRALSIEGSPHFRGWSEMHNERDWREQIHLGRERPRVAGAANYWRLQGPNLWPADPAWRAVVTAYMEGVAELGELILCSAVAELGADAGSHCADAGRGYLLMKLIGYHPQSLTAAPRPGVAPHVDFSWVTITLQDGPGLEVRSPDGEWAMVEPDPETVWVHPGELLQVATRGHYQATPHRVINPSIERTRVSVPIFINPPLDSVVPVFSAARTPAAGWPSLSASAREHVHRVIDTEIPPRPFHFGEAEWRRKGLDGWCHQCAPSRVAGVADLPDGADDRRAP